MTVGALFISLMKPLTYFLFKLADDSFSEFFTNSINFHSLALGKHHFRNEHRCGISVSKYRFSKFYTEEREMVKNDDRRVGMLPVRVTWWDFPGGPVGGPPRFHCSLGWGSGQGLFTDLGTSVPHTTQCGQRK